MTNDQVSPVYPQTYDELVRDYGNLIYSLLLRHNKVEQNLEDLHSYVWMKLLEAQLLARFEEHVQKQHPKVLTALKACDVLGVSWLQWSSAMSAFHKGIAHQGSSGRIICFKVGHWMPTPINLLEFQESEVPGYLHQEALYSYLDVMHLAHLDRTFEVVGQKIQDGMVVAPDRPEGRVKKTPIKVTKNQFKNYLIMSVLNHYANFCRTKVRRHKERPVNQPSYGEEDAPQVWEATLPDVQTADTELQLTLVQACSLLSDTIQECVRKSELSESVEFYEEKVFTSLSTGSSIMQALKNAGLPAKAQKAILKAVRPKVAHYS